MTNEYQQTNGSGFPGSPENDGGSGSGSAGQAVDLSQYVLKTQHDELERKMGEMGNELGDSRKQLGEYKDYLQEISPLMTILADNPKTISAIVNGKIDDSLANAVLEGKLTVKQAEAHVAKAADEVKQEIGSEAFKGLTPEQLVDMVTTKVNASVAPLVESVRQEIEDVKQTSSLEREIDEFVANTADIAEYADKIETFLDTHPGIKDIQHAYLIVKGMESMNARAEADQKAIAEASKEAALNVGGAGGQGDVQTGGWLPYVTDRPNSNTFGM